MPLKGCRNWQKQRTRVGLRLVQKKKSTKGGFHVTLNIRGCIFAGFVFFLAIVWAFILGVIVGRGYGPIDVITPLKKKVLSSPLKATQSKNNTSKEKVLSPTELTFFEKGQTK